MYLLHQKIQYLYSANILMNLLENITGQVSEEKEFVIENIMSIYYCL
jgi:hypothetical protein